MEKIEQLVNTFNQARHDNESFAQLDLIAAQIQFETMKAYSQDTTFVVRRNKFSEFELQKWERLEQYINTDKTNRLFDNAFGSGRDLLIAQQLGYEVYGCELSEFLYNDFLDLTTIQKENLFLCDMQSIPIQDKMFDVVRHNASFLHMPIIGKGYTIHACLEETHRILKNNGVLYICTKEGNGFVALDTLDGLGSRSFQYFNENSLQRLLLECGFKAIEINHYERTRNGQIIAWIEAFAKKE